MTPTREDAVPTDSTNSLNPWVTREYLTGDWPFRDYTAAAIGYDDLTDMRSDDGPLWKERAQNTLWHKRFYSFFPAWEGIFHDFIYDVVASWMNEPFYFQRVPTFRIHFPRDVVVGTFHTDAEYHHPQGEITFWLPLTPAYDTNTVWIADDADELRPANATYGNVIEFSSVMRRHGTKVNETGKSRVSFDFRCLPTRLLPTNEGELSESTKLRFVPGEYYATDVAEPNQ
jgi:hypothetical protein